MPAHHAGVEVLDHLAEGVWWRLAFTANDDAHVSDCQSVLRPDCRGSAEGQEDALRGGRAVVHVGAAAIGRGLNDLTVLDQPLLTLIERAERSVPPGNSKYPLRQGQQNCVTDSLSVGVV